MKVLFVSETGLNLGLAMRCDSDGHDVRYHCPTGCGTGIIKTYDEGDIVDMVIFDSNTYASRAERMRDEGTKILGTSRWASMLSHDGTYRSQLIQAMGFNLNGVSSGTNFYVTAWFNGERFIAHYLSLVYRRFMAGGAGPDLSCTGMVAAFKDVTPKTFDTFVAPLEKSLKRLNHRGPVHIHVLANREGWCVKDIDASFIHPLSLLLFENTNLAASAVMLSLFDETSKPLKPVDGWAAGLQLSVTPFPHGELKADRFIQTQGIIAANINHLWLANVSRRDNGYVAHAQGLLGYVTARGYDEHECVRRMYRTVGNLKVPDLQYRNDVGRNTQVLLTNLRQAGWLA